MVGGLPLAQLAERVGQTPFYAYARQLIKQRVAELRAALPASVKLHFAMKANPMPAVVGYMAGLVDGIDVASAGELKVALDAAGWPIGAPQVWLDLTAEGLNPDGAVIDAEGRFWNAQWGAGRAAAYGPDGAFLQAVETPGALQSSCPAFGGPDLSTLFITTALEHMDAEARAKHPASGQLFAFPGVAKGLPEPQVIT